MDIGNYACKKRIMFAVPSYWPSQDGVAHITEYLAEGLAAKGHEVLVYTSAGNGGLQELPFKEEHEGVLIERIRVYVRWPLRIKGRDKFSTPDAYFSKIKTYKPDVLIVVCSQTWTFDWMKGFLDQLDCVKIFYSHGYSKWCEHYDYWAKLKHRNILGVWEQYLCKRYYDCLYRDIARFDLAIYLSEQNNAALYAQKHKLTNGKILENAIDDVFFQPYMKHNYDEEKRAIDFLFVANYSENKNHKMLIDPFCKADIEESNLIFAGFEENEYLCYLKDYSKKILSECSGKKIVFNVHLPRKEVIDLYKSSDVFVCSSKSETWSIVAHEAAATAMPIISTDVGIYSEITGAIIVHNTEEMKSAMEKLYYDDNERRTCGELTYQWLHTRKCRTKDKIDWLDDIVMQLCENR